ncbi:four helix bundle protein [Candidatus Peregrinibacteria bacterium]|nr:four helix bundle protein [Candidatus Peregrinibacteria bacterium]
MTDFRFERLRVYHQAKELHMKIVLYTKNFLRESFYLKDQIRRSSLSVVLNIAEGSGKQSTKEQNRFFEHSFASISETVAAIDIAIDSKLIVQSVGKELMLQYQGLRNQLGALCKSLKIRYQTSDI